MISEVFKSAHRLISLSFPSTPSWPHRAYYLGGCKAVKEGEQSENVVKHLLLLVTVKEAEFCASAYSHFLFLHVFAFFRSIACETNETLGLEVSELNRDWATQTSHPVGQYLRFNRLVASAGKL